MGEDTLGKDQQSARGPIMPLRKREITPEQRKRFENIERGQLAGQIAQMRQEAVAASEAGDVTAWEKFDQTIASRIMLEQRLRALEAARKYRDALTGLPNRTCLMAVFDEMRTNPDAVADTAGFLMVDIDNFKRINDTYGHPQGDRVLQAVAQTLRDGIDRRDFCGRWGGEEFLIVVMDSPLKGKDRIEVLEMVGERLRGAVEQLEITGFPKITVSIGGAPFSGAKRFLINAGVQAADRALYESKQNGRDQVTVIDY